MLSETLWMVGGGIAAALIYGACRFVARWRVVNFIGPAQFAGLLDDEGEHALAERLRELTGEADSWPDEAIDRMADGLEEPDEHEGRFV